MSSDTEWVTLRITYREAALLSFACAWLAISETIPQREAFDMAAKIQGAIMESNDDPE